jgi:hypothetical protein
LGLNPHEAARLQPGRSIPRTFELISDTEQQEFAKPVDLILAKGAAVGLDEINECRHFWPGRGMRFLGFLVGQNENRAAVRTRASVVLKIKGARAEDRGAPVYAEGPNSFSLHKSAGAAEIGLVRFVQDGQTTVAFKRADDLRPLDLKY